MPRLLLDYDLDQHRTSGYPDVQQVSVIVRELVDHYPELLTQKNRMALRSIAAQLSRARGCRIAASRFDRHPLAAAGLAAPVYSALHPDSDDPYCQVDRTVSPLAIPRLVLLISWAQPNVITTSTAERLSNACRNWCRSGNPVERAELAADLSPLIRSHEWPESIRYLRQVRQNGTGGLSQRCGDFITAFRAADKLDIAKSASSVIDWSRSDNSGWFGL